MNGSLEFIIEKFVYSIKVTFFSLPPLQFSSASTVTYPVVLMKSDFLLLASDKLPRTFYTVLWTSKTCFSVNIGT